MDERIELSEVPTGAAEVYMIAGWRQWADAGAVSSGLLPYLVKHTHAREIGRIPADPYYLFQLPGLHHLLRPEIKLEEGYRRSLQKPQNRVWYAETGGKGLVLFLGDEPHLQIDPYASAFFELAQKLRVRRIVSVGGVYGAVPFDKDRQISCTYSLPRLKEEMTNYAVSFSNYEGGVSIGSYLADRAEQLGVEYLVLYPLVPMYDLSQLSPNVETVMVEQDYKAWYDLMQRVEYMFKLGLDLGGLERRARRLVTAMSAQVRQLEERLPDLEVRDFITRITAGFQEPSFLPLDDVWKSGLGDVLQDLE